MTLLAPMVQGAPPAMAPACADTCAQPTGDTTPPADAAPAATPAPAPAAPPATAEDEEPHITVSARQHVSYDPLEKANKVSFEVVQAVDRAVVGPVAQGYERVVPEPLRDGIHNMVHNLREPYIAINFLLQHRVGKSAETVARFAINSTLGIAGIFDIARRKPVHLPRRPNGFADTMAFYGVKSGPYLFLPLIGPTTVRDMIGNGLDRLVIPLALGRIVHNPLYGAPLVVFGAMDRRLKNNGRIEHARDAANPYTTLREDYLQRRRIEIEGLHYHRPAKGAPASPPPTPPEDLR